MGTLAGILNHQTTAGQVLTHNTATPAASSTSGTGSTTSTGSTSASSSNSATVSANDFLTLLVTEMQNQDPTANTDPNEYINQLVNVNSLEQLIDINQTLTTDSTPSSTGAGAKPVVTPAASAANPAASPSATASLRTAAPVTGSPLATTSGAAASSSSPASYMSGNLSAPNATPAAQRVGHALAGRTHASLLGATSPANQ